MTKYRLIGRYGTFAITKVVKALNEEEAFAETGIKKDLESAGWTFIEGPDGEEWEIETV